MKKSKKNSSLLRMVTVLGGGLLLIAAFAMFHAPFLVLNVSQFGSGTASGYDLTFGDGAVAGITTAWVFSLILLLAAVVSAGLFVLDLGDIFTLKAVDGKVARFGLATCIMCLATVTGVLLFCVIPLVGAKSGWGLNFSLGAGSVLGAICTLLGGWMLGIGIALPAMKK